MNHVSLETLNKRADEMRLSPTPAEKEFAEILIERKIKFKSQVVIAPYIADFVFGRLIIELDGGVHDTQVEYDRQRLKTRLKEKLNFFGTSLRILKTP